MRGIKRVLIKNNLDADALEATSNRVAREADAEGGDLCG